MDFNELDNPAWWALNGLQQDFSEGTSVVKRYRRGILPFAAYDHKATNIEALNDYLFAGEIFFLIGPLPSLPAGWTIEKELPCVQMIMSKPVVTEKASIPITPLNATHRDIMFDLINKVQPGYYEPDTHLLGKYYGIWDKQKLVAIAGERMQMKNLTEISAICTDPAYTGQGYAQQLIAHICNSNLQQGNNLFLHVLTANERAIRLYKYMGFTIRREISFWKLQKH